ncbi:PTS fructose transporter subunit IIC [[Eubacterium] rectale]|uniref:PTS fructose transporter subunit IIC n=1 Tax=Agathobacter rectalis TaxID=39491 RepID=A0A7X2M9J6_9FIRM|nr:fructose-specific PTS transporter subunit EIIC [Agathobacter rectalis]MSC55022.1 PTS fructose transporter subunit IIC [Agathobacter rectalis]MSC88712.1 PTS fructose transporter subunit IIC [Agathobacter rectalis]MSD11004.1 PTS fructose transporter subunit IIC [Agathobacter rectalis]MSD22113.1 PTS fructose transporter subunit IIC [Agathobacter rectalis]MSD24801.1 PTS fructose transporter subunit IIC [Agathobacter rectalis]
MTIRDLLAAESINLNGTPAGKTEALNQCIDLMAKSGKIADVETYRKGVFAREEEGTTGIGMGIAIPHCKSDAVTKAGLAAMVVKDGVDFESLDGTPAKIIFLIAAPNTEDNVHLQVLSKLSVMLMDEQFTNSLINAGSVDEFLNIIDSAEKAKDEKEAAKEPVEVKKDDVFIVAVTACPTGIAHTYMAAEAIEKKAKELGYQVKVETRGSAGAKNVLTDDEIAKATGVIVACDTNVPTDRFDGKKVIECQVSDGINKTEELVKRIAAGDAPVFKASGKKEASHSSIGGKESIGHQIYKHLMNGVSHMLPFVVGGGILIAIAFLIDGFSVDLNSLPADQRANFGTITQGAALFKGIGGTAFGFMLPILAGFIAMSIADRPGLAVGFVGGSIAANGTSGFLGALVAGFVAGYIVNLLKKIFSKLPESLDGVKPVLLYPLLGIFLIGVIMQFVVEPPIGALNTAINNGLNGLNGASAVVLGVLLGGMMAIDMGGPVNKAAYVFGTASIAAGNYNIMAAVMIGGMVPPLAIALATIFFKNKFTAEERKAGPTNFIMGLSFITEGAIPFAASDPLHVLPACAVGSAVAGGLSMAFGCTLMAPHGGIFVVPTIGNPLMYLVALVIGAFIACGLLGLLKKKVSE